MTPAERKRLVGVLGRLGSDFDGERAGAGLLADRMLKSAGITWEDLLAGNAETKRRRLDQPACHWRTDIGVCLRHVSFLRQWEQKFVANISQLITLSSKQRAILAEIANALRDRGRA